MGLKKKTKDMWALRKAAGEARKKNADVFYAALMRIEGEINKIAEAARKPRRSDTDGRFVADESTLRKLSDAAFAIRRARDMR